MFAERVLVAVSKLRAVVGSRQVDSAERDDQKGDEGSRLPVLRGTVASEQQRRRCQARDGNQYGACGVPWIRQTVRSFLPIPRDPEVIAVIDRILSPTAILHLQKGFILSPHAEGEKPLVFQARYHQDFPLVLNGYLASLNVFFAIDAFTKTNGATWVVPNSSADRAAGSTRTAIGVTATR